MRLRLGLALLALAAISPALAQSTAAEPDPAAAFVFRGVPASDALAALAAAGQADVVYSTDLVGTEPVWCGGPGWTTEDLLRCITGGVGLDFVRRSTGTYVVVERVVERVAPGAVVGLVLDGETGEPLPLAHVRLAHAAVVTDESGHFVLRTLPPGPHVLTASYVGYRARRPT